MSQLPYPSLLVTSLIQQTNAVLFWQTFRRFPSCISPLFESESKCEAVHMEISFIHMQMTKICMNKTNFHMKCFALGLAFKQRRNATQKSPITFSAVPPPMRDNKSSREPIRVTTHVITTPCSRVRREGDAVKAS